MTTVTQSDAPARPVPLSRVWAGPKVLAEDLQGEDLADVLHLHSKASAWWVICEGDDQLHSLVSDLGLDALALRDLTAHDQRVVYEEFESATLLVTHAAEVDTEGVALRLRSARMVLTEQVLVCVADSDPAGFAPAKVLAAARQPLAANGVEGAAEVLVVAVLESYESVLAWLEDESDRLADAIFAERPLSRQEQARAFRLRAVLTRLRRVIAPMVSVLADLLNSDRRAADQVRHWTKIAARLDRVAHSADALGETLASVFATSLALSDDRSNQVMKKLSGWAAIVAVPTLVTGFVGMNVFFPLHDSRFGFWIYLVVMVGAVLVLYVLFKRKEWI